MSNDNTPAVKRHEPDSVLVHFAGLVRRDHYRESDGFCSCFASPCVYRLLLDYVDELGALRAEISRDRDALQVRIDAGLSACDSGSQFGLIQPDALHKIRAALSGPARRTP